MEPIYKGFQDISQFYQNYGFDEKTDERNQDWDAREALGLSHNHTCWLNPPGGMYNRKTKRLCKKYWKKRDKPQLEEFMDLCDMCPNSIIYYKDYKRDNFLLAFGNSYAYHKQGLMEKR